MVVLALFDEVAHEGFDVDAMLEVLLLNLTTPFFRLPGSLSEDVKDFVFAEILRHELHLLLQLIMLLL